MKVLVWVLVIFSAGLASQLPLRITTSTWQAHVPKAAAQALAAYLVVTAVTGSALAVWVFLKQPSAGMGVAAFLGVAAVLLSGGYLYQVRSPNDALAQAFGPGWEQQIPAERAEAMLQRRWQWTLPDGAEPRWEGDVVYWRLADSDRELLADLWQPPEGVETSGLALIYLHGGYYEMLDKDSGTRPLFRHLTRQGHIVMDISYRLVDETDIFGMVDDVKRAVAWMKDHAIGYGVDPEKIVLAGASNGGNLALLAGYTAGHPHMTPDDVHADTSVLAVVAYYGVHDWPAFSRLSTDDDLAPRLMGGTPEEVPDRYGLASPVFHVDADTPTTLLVQGLHDQQHLIDANRSLHQALIDAGIPAANIELSGTDHAFDLMPPGLGPISPPGISVLYDLERFLALLARPTPLQAGEPEGIPTTTETDVTGWTPSEMRSS